MLGLAAFALVTIPLWAQDGRSSAQKEQLARAARNPYDLARFVDSHLGFDWDVMWKALGTEPLFIQPCGKLSDSKKQCTTELITVLNPDQVILVIHGDVTPRPTSISASCRRKTENGGFLAPMRR